MATARRQPFFLESGVSLFSTRRLGAEATPGLEEGKPRRWQGRCRPRTDSKAHFDVHDSIWITKSVYAHTTLVYDSRNPERLEIGCL